MGPIVAVVGFGVVIAVLFVFALVATLSRHMGRLQAKRQAGQDIELGVLDRAGSWFPWLRAVAASEQITNPEAFEGASDTNAAPAALPSRPKPARCHGDNTPVPKNPRSVLHRNRRERQPRSIMMSGALPVSPVDTHEELPLPSAFEFTAVFSDDDNDSASVAPRRASKPVPISRHTDFADAGRDTWRPKRYVRDGPYGGFAPIEEPAAPTPTKGVSRYAGLSATTEEQAARPVSPLSPYDLDVSARSVSPVSNLQSTRVLIPSPAAMAWRSAHVRDTRPSAYQQSSGSEIRGERSTIIATPPGGFAHGYGARRSSLNSSVTVWDSTVSASDVSERPTKSRDIR